MRLFAGALAYLAFVGVVVVAALAGLSAIERSRLNEFPVVARGEDTVSRKAHAFEDANPDPGRVPVWIAATPKYQYAPVPVDPRPKHIGVGKDARAMAKSRRSDRRQDGLRAIDSALRDQRRDSVPSLGFAPSRRDNDPFFRD